jgi:methionyl-tRNA synthetase
MGRFYITTPIYYVNDYPHIGHAYCTICADAFARYHRSMGDRTFFLTGTDEHGQKVEKSAAREGITPQALADRVVQRYHQLWKQLDITHDDFIRTTQDRHEKGVLAILDRLVKAGDVYKASYRGPYCVSCEAFFPENQLVDGTCPDFGHPVSVLEEESYFFRLSKYQEPLLELYRKQPDFVLPESRMNEVRSFVESGLKDLSISRTSISWGIPFSGDEKHVLYVWLDALSNYITALGYGSADTALYDAFWPADVHLIGKDILRFHAVYWPAFLMSAGLPLPKHVYGHGWWMKDASKMSKSLGNVVDPRPFIEEFGSDAVRYFLLRDKPIGTDGSFSDEAFLDRVNADLANDLGNLASRLTNLLERQAEGHVGPGDGSLEKPVETALEAYHSAMRDLSPRDALAAIWQLISDLNKYLVERAPWSAPGTTESLDTLSEAGRALRAAAICIEPVMPGSAAAILDALGFDGSDLASYAWGDGQAKPAHKLTQLFPRVDKKAYFAKLENSKMDQSTNAPDTPEKPAERPAEPFAPAKTEAGTEPERLSIDEFRRVELRAGKILEAERIPKSNKLMRLVVDLGSEHRQIVAGIAKKYAPEDLVGKTCPFVCNLQPAKLMGVESNGMIMAGNLDGEPILLQFLEEVPPGSPIT